MNKWESYRPIPEILKELKAIKMRAEIVNADLEAIFIKLNAY